MDQPKHSLAMDSSQTTHTLVVATEAMVANKQFVAGTGQSCRRLAGVVGTWCFVPQHSGLVGRS